MSSFILKKNIIRPPINDNFKHIPIPKKLRNESRMVPIQNSILKNNAKLSNRIVCDRDIYNMNYNMQTIKKRVAPLFENPNKSCHYFASIGITNLNLTTYNEFIHDQAKICFKILNDFETSRKITYAVFAGNSVGLLRAGRNLPWADDYDIILFNHDIAFFTSHIVPELERIGFKVKPIFHDGIASGAKIFGPPVSFAEDRDSVNQSLSIFQCDVFYSYFDSRDFLKNSGGWGLYHQKNIPRSVVFPLKRRNFHGMLLPFFNDSLKEAELCYGDIQKCAIFSHHLDSTIFYKWWQHAYKDFDHIKKTSIENTRKRITGGGGKHLPETATTTTTTLSLTSLEDAPQQLRDILLRDSNHYHNSVLKKLDFLRYLYQNNIGVIVISPLTSLQSLQCYNTQFVLEDLKHKKKIDASNYNYYAPGLKLIGDHAADIKYYFPNIRIVYEEDNVTDAPEYVLSPLFYKYIDAIRVSRVRYEQLYRGQIILASEKYGMTIPTVEIIEQPVVEQPVEPVE